MNIIKTNFIAKLSGQDFYCLSKAFLKKSAKNLKESSVKIAIKYSNGPYDAFSDIERLKDNISLIHDFNLSIHGKNKDGEEVYSFMRFKKEDGENLYKAQLYI